mmetsp:Transcript_1772/g.6172  ORF Transcript_1772/g.6172 Transcript_1772/m.6172 type:complete len:323 (-) Transcript_1772:68-1036(-)
MGCGNSTQSGVKDGESFQWEEEESGGAEAPKPPPASMMRRKRQSVSAECYTPGQAPVQARVVDKSSEDSELIKELISNNILFKSLDREQIATVVGAFEKKEFPAGHEVITQGDKVADWYYVVASGSAEALKDGEAVKTYDAGGAFGELALLYNAPRAATVKATADLVTWALDRETFRTIVVDSNAQRRRDYESFLGQVPLLGELDEGERSCIADVLEPVYYNEGDVIIKEGDVGDMFYILENGTAEAYNSAAPSKKLPYQRGDYFGELALIKDAPRKATVVATDKCKVAQMDSAAFKRLLGKMEDILHRNAAKYEEYMKEIE